jgi:hypothetical protein
LSLKWKGQKEEKTGLSIDMYNLVGRIKFEDRSPETEVKERKKRKRPAGLSKPLPIFLP